jgi:hypothetical protein
MTSDIADLVERLERLEATNGIRARLHAYGASIDRRNVADFVGCFTRDGAWYAVVPTSADDRGEIGGRRVGHEALERAGRKMIDALTGPTQHLLIDPLIEVLGPDDATASSTFVTLQSRSWGGPPVVISSGRYVDRLRREAGVWRFADRRCEIEMSAPLDG